MLLNKNLFSDEAVVINGNSFYYRAYRNVAFADKPKDDVFHRMNITPPHGTLFTPATTI